MKMITVYMLAYDPTGEMVLVKGRVEDLSNDGDFSVEMANASKKLTSLAYTVCGQFLESDPAASLVDLDACKLIF